MPKTVYWSSRVYCVQNEITIKNVLDKNYSNFLVDFLTVDAITPTPQHQFLFPPFNIGFDPRLHDGRHPMLKYAESRSPDSDFNFPIFLFRLRMRSVQEAHLPLSAPPLKTESLQNDSSVSVLSSFVDETLSFRGILMRFVRHLELCKSTSSSSSLLFPRLWSQEWSSKWQWESSLRGGVQVNCSSVIIFSTVIYDTKQKTKRTKPKPMKIRYVKIPK